MAHTPSEGSPVTEAIPTTEVPIPEPGQAVLVRNRPAAVRERIEHTGAVTRETFHLIDVEYLDGWDFPAEDRIVWEREWKAEILRDAGLPRGIDDPSARPDPVDRYHAFVDALRWSSLARVPGLTSEGQDLTAPWQGAVAVEAYQLWPVMQALDMPRVALLLADDVGLGKTIQAGLVITELMARRRLRRILVVCPASLQLQWRDEMREKFSLDFTVVDRGAITDIQREYGMDTNPWTVTPRAITSMDFLRQPDVLSQFLASAEVLERGHELAWDALVVDEAHNVSPQGFGQRSQRSQSILDVSAHFEHRLFLTATPHNGFTVSFSGLLELLDPVRFRQTAELTERDRDHLGTVMVRRLKSELNQRAEERGHLRPFPRREVDGRDFSWAASEHQVVAALRDYKAAGEQLLRELPKSERGVGRFVFSLLTKRLLSSHYAFARTWWQHIAGYGVAESDLAQVNAAKRRAEEQTSDDVEKARREEDAARQGASWLARHGEKLADARDRVSDALEALGWSPEIVEWDQLPDDIDLPDDGKWQAFEAWLDKYLLSGQVFRDDERAILFTEYKDTHEYILTRLAARGWEDPHVRFLFGGSSLVEREDVKLAFNDPADPLRVLVATDVAAEGLNLQASCRYVFHWEIPWNPMRLEQRNGRVDRHGQPRDVTAFHFSSQHDEDVRFLDYVVQKVHQVREDLGSVGEVIDASVEEHFTAGGVDEQELDLRVDQTLEIAPERTDMAEARRPLDEQSGDDAEQALHRTEQRLQLDPQRLARLLQVAIELDGGRLESEGDLYRLAQVPTGWARLVDDHLRIQRGAQQGAIPRIVFDADYFVERTGDRQVFRSRTDVALIRLGHPLVQRALARLRQRLWQPDALIGRWTIAVGEVAEPTVVVASLAQAGNELREPLHTELLEFAFQTGANHPPADLPPAHRSALSKDGLSAWRNWIAEEWDHLHAAIDSVVGGRRDELAERLGGLLQEQLKDERTRQRQLYDHRLKELAKEPTDRAIERIRRELLKAEEQAQQRTFFAEDNLARTQRVAELESQLEQKEFERISRQRERLRERLEVERERMLEQVLPRRFALARFQLAPIAVELVVPEGSQP
jgi:superfamily II DNA or RNA helicase